MSHDIFGERFYSRGIAGWHLLGTVSEEPDTAVSGLEKAGEFTVRDEEVFRLMPDGTYEPIPFQLIVRDATHDAKEEMFNVVSQDYRLITPRQFAQLWDERVRQPIETMFALKGGRQLGITTKLPEFEVAGDACENYLVALNGMDGVSGAKVLVAPVRVVCRNTLRMAEKLASETYVVRHEEGVEEKLGAWMETVYTTAEQKTEAMREVCELLAQKKPTVKQVSNLIEITYPMRPVQPEDVPLSKAARTACEYNNRAMAKRREAVQELFEGKGTGMDVPAANKTLWGYYNCVTELENFRSGPDEARGTNILMGDRGQTMIRAFNAASALVGVK